MTRKILRKLPVSLIMISAFVLTDNSFMRTFTYAADQAVSQVLAVDKAKREVQVGNPKGGSFKMNERLSLRIDDKVVVLRVTTPMASFSRCAVEKGAENLDKIAKGMPVHQGILKGEENSIKPGAEKTFSRIEMVYIPAGLNHKKVKMQAFWMGKYEVTQKQYESVMGENPSNFKGKSDYPVERVHWYNAVEFCNKLSRKAGFKPYYTIDKNRKDPDNKHSSDPIKWTVTINEGAKGFRLPTSEEWEYACRAGTGTKYYWGDSDPGDFCWYSENSMKTTHPAGKKKPNAWGLHDMSGNVWEWCFNWYGGGTSGSYRVGRGGSWSNDAGGLKSGYVDSGYPSDELDSIGFRLAGNME